MSWLLVWRNRSLGGLPPHGVGVVAHGKCNRFAGLTHTASDGTNVCASEMERALRSLEATRTL